MQTRYNEVTETASTTNPIEITEDFYWAQLEVLPPAYQKRWAFMVGEPFDHNKDWEPMYSAFYEKNDKHYYVGIMTIKQFKEFLTSL